MCNLTAQLFHSCKALLEARIFTMDHQIVCPGTVLRASCRRGGHTAKLGLRQHPADRIDAGSMQPSHGFQSLDLGNQAVDLLSCLLLPLAFRNLSLVFSVCE